MDQRRIAVESEDDRTIDGEQLIEGNVIKAVRTCSAMRR
jgi:hypothetical protein